MNIVFIPLNECIELCCPTQQILQILSWKRFIVFQKENSASRVLSIALLIITQVEGFTEILVLLETDILIGANTIWLEASKPEISSVILGK